MRVTVYSTRPDDREQLVGPSQGSEAVCVFVNADASAPVIERLHAAGTRLLLLRSAGHNHVDLARAADLGLQVGHVPAYSPCAVHAVGLLLALNRRIHRAYNRVREHNFALTAP